jgi:predicted transposase/invertase (TIGR01784 family)
VVIIKYNLRGEYFLVKAERHDLLFKRLLETFFVEFIELFFPQVSNLMDKEHINFLTQEVITDVPDMEKHLVDILVETKLAGEEGIVLIHVESQAQRDPEYNRKMFRYFSRLHDKHHRKILPVVIYSHDVNVVEPDNYKVGFSFLEVLSFKFLIVQLRKEPWRKYIRSNNPVATALISKMNYTGQEKISVKLEFSRMLATMQLDVARNSILTAFMETYLKLSPEEEAIYRDRFKTELKPEEVERLLEITTSYHEQGRAEGRAEGKVEGRAEGRAEGKAEGKAEIAKKLLDKMMSFEEIEEITGLTREEIEQLKKQK